MSAPTSEDTHTDTKSNGVRVTSQSYPGQVGTIAGKPGIWHALVQWDNGTRTCEHMSTLTIARKDN